MIHDKKCVNCYLTVIACFKKDYFRKFTIHKFTRHYLGSWDVIYSLFATRGNINIELCCWSSLKLYRIGLTKHVQLKLITADE